MTNKQHPNTPPPELFKQWEDNILNERDNVDYVLDCAWRDGFQAGADQELEACCEWLDNTDVDDSQEVAKHLRAARRPRPLSLRELALASVKRLEESGEFFSDQMRELEFIRKALEQFND